jgi:hypothetical protein
MVNVHRLGGVISLGLLLILPLAGCTGNTALQQAFSADPSTSRWGNNPASPAGQMQIPAGFPRDLRYETATLLSVNQTQNNLLPAIPAPARNLTWQQTRWQTADPAIAVKNFYRQQLQREGWQLLPPSGQAPLEQLIGRKQNLQVVVTFPVSPSPNNNTEFELSYTQTQDPANIPANISALPTTENQPQPGDPNFIGPILPPGTPLNNSSTGVALPQRFSDLATAPPALQPELEDMARLGVLTGDHRSPNLLHPNQPIARRTFARWLVLTNNRLYRDRPARQIRLASPSDAAVFRDVPATDPDFAYIQGLAEAGYLPSTLSGDAIALIFEPNAPLRRESLLQWKVPVDLGQSLPTATVESVRQAWGFKDANRIAPEALQSVLADHKNGDLSNIRRLFGATLLLQPKKPISRAEAAVALWYVGVQGDGFSAADVYKNEQQSLGQNSTAPPLPN